MSNPRVVFAIRADPDWAIQGSDEIPLDHGKDARMLMLWLVNAVPSGTVSELVKMLYEKYPPPTTASIELLKHLYEWDVMDTGDGEYWKREIRNCLGTQKGG